MSKLNYLEKLLDGAEVKWKPLSELVTLRRGRVMSKEYLVDNAGDFPVYSSQTAKNGMIGKIDTYDFDGEYITWTTDGANAGTVFHRTGKFSITNVCGSIKIDDEAKLNYKFLFYWLSIEAQKHVYSGMGNPKLMSHQVEKIPIPIPCPDDPKKSLEIQAEIVRILDAFTALTAELTAELTARKKQYNYYRDQLLTFSDDVDVELKSLGDVTLPTSNIRWKDTDRPYRYIDLTSVSRENNSIVETIEITAENAPSRAQKLVEKDDVIFATTRPTQLRLCLIDEEYAGEVASTGYCVLRANKSKVLPKWIYYHLSSMDFFNYVEGNQSGSAYPAISDSKVKEFTIPIPYANDPQKSLAEQARIVNILDKFDALTNSISEGLPREIELRQKQYEYYRDLLLSFPKAEEVAA